MAIYEFILHLFAVAWTQCWEYNTSELFASWNLKLKASLRIPAILSAGSLSVA